MEQMEGVRVSTCKCECKYVPGPMSCVYVRESLPFPSLTPFLHLSFLPSLPPTIPPSFLPSISPTIPPSFLPSISPSIHGGQRQGERDCQSECEYAGREGGRGKGGREGGRGEGGRGREDI